MMMRQDVRINQNRFSRMKYRNKQYLEQQYIELKKSMRDISIELGCGETVIHKWMHRFGIPVRTRSESMSGIQKTKSHKENLSISRTGRFTGSDNPNWKNGITKKNKIIRERGYARRRKNVLERDNYECQECGLDMYLHIHHIKQIKDYPELANDTNNCITLCKYCHRQLHSKQNLANSANSTYPEKTTDNAELNLDDPFVQYMLRATNGATNKCVETIHETPSNGMKT